MKFIGENGLPFPTLNMCNEEILDYLSVDINQFLREVLENVKKLYSAGLVHADLSEYNILVTRKGPVLIDLSQAVSVKHPNAKEFLKKDLTNLLKICQKWNVNIEDRIRQFANDKGIEL